MGHETPWNRQAVGSSQTPRHRPAASGKDVPRRGSRREGVREFPGAVGPGLSEERAEGTAGAGHAGAALAIVDQPARTVPTPAGRGGRERRVRDRLVDTAAHGQADRQALWRPLHHRGRVEAVADRPGLELAKARTPSHPAGRGGHRTLEEHELAPYKKTPRDVGPISRSSTKAAFCSCPTWRRPGRQEGTRRCCAIATRAIGSPRSPASPSPRGTDAWACMWTSTRPTSPGWRS